MSDDDNSVFTEENGERRYVRPGEFVRACGKCEVIAAAASKYRSFNTVTHIRLDSKIPLKPEDARRALWIVSRRFPHLQCCLSKRNGKLWLKRMLKLEIDLETRKNSLNEVVSEMLDTSFDHYNGPLWKVRLVHSEMNLKSGPDRKFSIFFVLVAMHTITDGISNVMICRDFVSIMNELTSGSPVMSMFSPIIDTIDKVARKSCPRNFLLKDPCRMAILTALKSVFHNWASLSDNISLQKANEVKTKVLVDNFSKSLTKNMISMCKKEKITVNTFICTVVNFSLLTVMQSMSKSDIGKQKIVVSHCVNTRRHFEPQHREVPGFHVALLVDNCQMKFKDIDHFWSVARKNYSDFQEKLEIKNEHLKLVPISNFITSLFKLNNFLTKNGLRNKAVNHYISSNIGNLQRILPEPNEDDNFVITYLSRSCSLQMTGTPFMINFQTFNNELTLSMDYCTNQITSETAQEIFSMTCKSIESIVTLNTNSK